MCEEYGLQNREIGPASWTFLKAGCTLLERNRELGLDKIRGLGFTEEFPVGYGYFRDFGHLASEKIIPASFS
jgi:hypothetical protein